MALNKHARERSWRGMAANPQMKIPQDNLAPMIRIGSQMGIESVPGTATAAAGTPDMLALWNNRSGACLLQFVDQLLDLARFVLRRTAA
jgi:hypothetical protein